MCKVIIAAVLACTLLTLCQAQDLNPFVLKNSNGMEAHILPYGAIVQKLLVPDATGTLQDVALGFDQLQPYENGTSPYFGAVVGRVANRIANSTFELDGVRYHVVANENSTSLHGGKIGFSRHTWTGQTFKNGTSSGVRLQYLSPDGDQGYPGNLTATVTYLLTEDNQMQVAMQATTDKATPVNLAQHTYFNLNGVNSTSSTILNHYAQINASYITPVDAALIPTGTFEDVYGTVFDLNNSTLLNDTVTKVPGYPAGYDINYVLWGVTGAQAAAMTNNGKLWDTPRHAATFSSPKTGITLELDTTQPGLQLYTGNQLNNTSPIRGKNGVAYPQYSAFVLETQDFPNAINTPNFPNSVLRPGNTYNNIVVWRFSNSTVA